MDEEEDDFRLRELVFLSLDWIVVEFDRSSTGMGGLSGSSTMADTPVDEGLSGDDADLDREALSSGSLSRNDPTDLLDVDILVVFFPEGDFVGESDSRGDDIDLSYVFFFFLEE